jgi:hypothetical protein
VNGALYTSTLALTEQLLSETYDADVRLNVTEAPRPDGERHLVLRCELTQKPDDAPDAVIVKRAQQQESGPQVDGFRPSDMLLNEWASLEFLGALDTETAFAPKFICGDIDATLIVTEEIPNVGSLADPLLGDNSDNAEEALISFARLLGDMHATTAGKSQGFDQVRSTIGINGLEFGEYRRLIVANLNSALDQLELSPSQGFHSEIEQVLDSMTSPGPFQSFVHGDPCPDNVLMTGSGIRLIDFENA